MGKKFCRLSNVASQLAAGAFIRVCLLQALHRQLTDYRNGQPAGAKMQPAACHLFTQPSFRPRQNPNTSPIIACGVGEEAGSNT